MGYAQLKEEIKAMPKEKLESDLFNRRYNDFLGDWADYKRDDVDKHGHGKRLPYIGWFWRTVNFWDKMIPIGNCGDFIGFMENNKWDYDQRTLTEDEFENAMAIIDAALYENSQGGNLAEIIARVEGKLDELWEYFQTLTIRNTLQEPGYRPQLADAKCGVPTTAMQIEQI